MHALRIPTGRLPRCAPFCEAGGIWKMIQGGQLLAFGKIMRNLTSGLDRAGTVILPGWLKTIGDKAECCSQ